MGKNVAITKISEATRRNALLLVAFILLPVIPLLAQYVTVSGVVKDAETQEPVGTAYVTFPNSSSGAITGIDGRFTASNSLGIKSIKISSMAYNDTIITLNESKTVDLTIFLTPRATSLSAVTVTGKQTRYVKKDNPAIEFMRATIAQKNENRISSKSYYKVERYEKFTTSLNSFDSTKKVFNKFSFLKQHIDTSEVDRTPILTLSLKETLADVYYRKTPKTKKEVLRAKKAEGIGKDLDESIDHNIKELFQGIDIYENSVKLFQHYFISPLSSTMAITFYKYYIRDTLFIEGVPCLEMMFFPYNHQSNGFIGSLFISLDGNYALKKAEMKIPDKINLNFARNLRFTQTFTQLPDSSWAVSEENLYANLYLFKGLPEVQVNQYRSYKDYDLSSWDRSVFEMSENQIIQNEKITNKSEAFWEEHRHKPVKQKETAMKQMLEKLRQMPIYQFVVRTSEFISSGYFLTGGSKEKSMFDIGPILSIYSFNHVEGSRFRLGGTTTANLCPHFFVGGYAAYSIRDNKFKYNGMLTYSINKKKYHLLEFPRNNLSLTYEYDIYTLGANSQHHKYDFLTSWQVGTPVTKMSYIRSATMEYEKDWDRRFNTKFWVKGQSDTPTGTLEYRVNSSDIFENTTKTATETVKSLSTIGVGVRLQCVFGGTVYNGRNPEMNNSKDATELVLTHFTGYNNFLNSIYAHTEFSVKKRINLSAFGFVDTKVNMGMVWTKAPFPLLIIPNANPSILIQSDAFHTMRPLEFVVDQYVGVNLTYHLNGLVFNRIPYINFLKLRGVVSFNGIMGSLSNKNNPQIKNDLFLLPEGTRPLGKVPFIEMSFGIENIFKLFRVDYFHRFTHTEGLKRKGGVRFTFGVNF